MHPKLFSSDNTLEDLDIFFMREALREAKKAYDLQEVPVGAVIVHNQKVIARGHNQVEMLKDATAHAEMLCISSANSYFHDWRLENTTLYCTLEPCAMCASAMFSARITRLVWAAADIRCGANGSWINLFTKKHPMHSIQVEKGVLENESQDLMKSFFQKLRHEKRKTKTTL